MPPVPCANSPSAAKLFVQLCVRRTASSSYAATPSSSAAILDVLLPPRIQARALHIRASQYRSPPRVNTTTTSTPVVASRTANTANARRHTAIGHRRAFTTSRPLAKTLAILNPQTDDDGNEMLLEITPRAANVGSD
ncbi:hypothetical protein NPX13_g10718 [Xylaria arbuscula]|uniref:Uncharacterized protein n=1 Tax=Xylaria arbuscula TaxID=114810 RepID=A0A9W8N479_9PEZI|nr:hypothetical protein NPX13_g10718 [Xylaria arbuscula]